MARCAETDLQGTWRCGLHAQAGRDYCHRHPYVLRPRLEPKPRPERSICAGYNAQGGRCHFQPLLGEQYCGHHLKRPGTPYEPPPQRPIPHVGSYPVPSLEALTIWLSESCARHALATWLRYGDSPRTLQAVGVQMGITGERSRQLVQKALRMLRHPTRRRQYDLDTQLQHWPRLYEAVYGKPVLAAP